MQRSGLLRVLGAISGLSGLFLLGCKCGASSTPTDPQIEVPGTYATGTLPLGPLWVSDVPGLVLGPSFGLLGLKTRKVAFILKQLK